MIIRTPFVHVEKTYLHTYSGRQVEDGDDEPGLLTLEGKTDEELLSTCLGPSARSDATASASSSSTSSSGLFDSSVLLDNDQGWLKPLTPILHSMDRLQTNRLLCIIIEHVCTKQLIDDRIGCWLFALLTRGTGYNNLLARDVQIYKAYQSMHIYSSNPVNSRFSTGRRHVLLPSCARSSTSPAPGKDTNFSSTAIALQPLFGPLRWLLWAGRVPT